MQTLKHIIYFTFITLAFNAFSNDDCQLALKSQNSYSSSMEKAGFSFTSSIWSIKDSKLNREQEKAPLLHYKDIIQQYVNEGIEGNLFYQTTLIEEGKLKNGFRQLLKATPIESQENDLFLLETIQHSENIFFKSVLVLKLDNNNWSSAISTIKDVSDEISKDCGFSG